MTTSRSQGNYDLGDIAHEAMLRHGLTPDFSAAVLEEAERAAEPAADAISRVSDLRALPWASIDNDDSRDLDQLSVAQTGSAGAVRILIAIADVDALVDQNSAMDSHARTNMTSVYTAARNFPMLPERLSTDLTSLAERRTRLAIVIDLTVTVDGTVTARDIYRAAVFNRAKLAYNSIAAWLDGTGPAPPKLAAVEGLDEQLRTQDRVAQAMRTKRYAHGALRLESSEARPVYEDNALVDMRPEPRNRAKDLIEDFMIAANGASANYLAEKGYPSLRRVLRSPKRWDRIVELAASLGERLPREPDAAALDAFLESRQRADPDRFPDISLSVVKLLGSGEYAMEMPGQVSEGHFGLAVRDYAHSTAPNRRFPDLIAQRLLKAALDGRAAPYANGELAALATHCTLQEDNATKVERQVRKSAAALLLASRIGESFDAIVTGASEKGTWVRISKPTTEGRVVRGFERLDVGDHVRVRLAGVDVARGFIDFVRPD